MDGFLHSYLGVQQKLGKRSNPPSLYEKVSSEQVKRKKKAVRRSNTASTIKTKDQRTREIQSHSPVVPPSALGPSSSFNNPPSAVHTRRNKHQHASGVKTEDTSPNYEPRSRNQKSCQRLDTPPSPAEKLSQVVHQRVPAISSSEIELGSF